VRSGPAGGGSSKAGNRNPLDPANRVVGKKRQMKVGFRLHHTHTHSLSLTRCIGVSGSNSIGTMMQNEKYGHGGPRKRMKTNTRESVDDLSGWNTRKNNTVDKDLHHLVVCSTCFALVQLQHMLLLLLPPPLLAIGC
jgi:hypothetical protein